jgi:hypothetical protein
MAERNHERVAEPEIATTTLAEIYVQQGLLDRALAIYRRVAERSPGDERVSQRVEEIERLRATVEAGTALAPDPGSPTEAIPSDRGSAAGTDPPASAPPIATRPSLPAAEDTEFLAWLERRT